MGNIQNFIIKNMPLFLFIFISKEGNVNNNDDMAPSLELIIILKAINKLTEQNEA